MGTKDKPGEFDCYANAADDQPMFVLLAGDPDAPDRVDEWARNRFRRLAADTAAGRIGDQGITRGLRKIAEALQCARAMREWKPKDEPIMMLTPLTDTTNILLCKGRPPQPHWRNLLNSEGDSP